MDAALLDTDILSEILKAKNQQVLGIAQRYLDQHLDSGIVAGRLAVGRALGGDGQFLGSKN
jgi:predicted nucleic acid-binding protein